MTILSKGMILLFLVSKLTLAVTIDNGTYILPSTLQDTINTLGLTVVNYPTPALGARCNPMQASDPCETKLGYNYSCLVVEPSTDAAGLPGVSEEGRRFYKQTCVYNEVCHLNDKSEQVLCKESCEQFFGTNPGHYNCGSALVRSNCAHDDFVSRCEAERDCSSKDVKCNYKKPCTITAGDLHTGRACNDFKECGSLECTQLQKDPNDATDDTPNKKVCSPVFQCVKTCAEEGEKADGTTQCCTGLVENGAEVCEKFQISGTTPRINSSVNEYNCKPTMIDEEVPNDPKAVVEKVFLAENFMRGYDWLFNEAGAGSDRWGMNDLGRGIARSLRADLEKIEKEYLVVRKESIVEKCKFLSVKGDGTVDEKTINDCVTKISNGDPFTLNDSVIGASNTASATPIFKMLAQQAKQDAKYYEDLSKIYGVTKDGNSNARNLEGGKIVDRLNGWNNYNWGINFSNYGGHTNWFTLRLNGIRLYANKAGIKWIPGIKDKYCIKECWETAAGNLVDPIYNGEFLNHEPSHIPKVSSVEELYQQVKIVADHFQINDLLLPQAHADDWWVQAIGFRRESRFRSMDSIQLLQERMKSLYKKWSEEKIYGGLDPRVSIIASKDDLFRIFSKRSDLGQKIRAEKGDEVIKSIPPAVRRQYMQHYVGSKAFELWSMYGARGFPGYRANTPVTNIRDTGEATGEGFGSTMAMFGGNNTVRTSVFIAATGGAGAIAIVGASALAGLASGVGSQFTKLDENCSYGGGGTKGMGSAVVRNNAHYLGEFYREYKIVKEKMAACYDRLANRMANNYADNKGVTINGSQIVVPRPGNLGIKNPQEFIAIDHSCKSKDCAKAPKGENNFLNGINLGSAMNFGDSLGFGEGDSGKGDSSLGSGNLGDGALGNNAIGKNRNIGDTKDGDTSGSSSGNTGKAKTSDEDMLRFLAKSKSPENKKLAETVTSQLSTGSTNRYADSLSEGLIAGGKPSDPSAKGAFDYQKFLNDLKNKKASGAGSIDLNKFKSQAPENTKEEVATAQDDKGGAHGLGNEEVDRILDSSKRHPAKYLGEPADDIFRKISKTYVRAAYPVLLIKKKD